MRAALACIGRGRAELVVAGCAVLQAICELWPAKRIRVADRVFAKEFIIISQRCLGQRSKF